MAVDRDELLALYQRTGQELDEAVAGLTIVQLSDPSLDGWSVKDHLALALWHASARTRSRAFPPDTGQPGA